MTVRDALNAGRKLLEASGSDTPYLDALVLLAHAMSIRKEKLLASFPDTLAQSDRERYDEYLTRRADGIPVSYIRGVKEFYGLEFHVDERVLVPRPDTETLIEAVEEILAENPLFSKIHDVCTGSGCIPITLKHLYPAFDVSASDISEDALEVFRLNSKEILAAELPHTKSDLLSEVNGRFDIITANPPYLTSGETRGMLAGGWPEPALALDGGEDGLDLVRRLIKEGLASLSPKGYLIIEAAHNQAGPIAEEMSRNGYGDIRIRTDLAGRQRVTLGRKGA